MPSQLVPSENTGIWDAHVLYLNLLSDLIGAAEDVSIILLESAHSREPRQRAGHLVSEHS